MAPFGSGQEQRGSRDGLVQCVVRRRGNSTARWTFLSTRPGTSRSWARVLELGARGIDHDQQCGGGPPRRSTPPSSHDPIVNASAASAHVLVLAFSTQPAPRPRPPRASGSAIRTPDRYDNPRFRNRSIQQQTVGNDGQNTWPQARMREPDLSGDVPRLLQAGSSPPLQLWEQRVVR